MTITRTWSKDMKTFLAIVGLIHLTLFLFGCIGLIDYKVYVGKATDNEAQQ